MRPLFVVAVLATACNQNYDKFIFEGGGASPGGGSQGGDGAGGVPGAGGGTASTAASTALEVPCGGSVCDVDQGEVCCVDADTGSAAHCETGCIAGEALLVCSGASDCSGQRCCLVSSGGNYVNSECRASCGAGTAELCDPADDPPCATGSCAAHPELAGYSVCN